MNGYDLLVVYIASILYLPYIILPDVEAYDSKLHDRVDNARDGRKSKTYPQEG